MPRSTLERRMELLKLEGNGLLQEEIVKELSSKYEVSARAIYYDFESRKTWQPILHQGKNSALKIQNRHEQLFRKASLLYIQAENNAQKIATINLMGKLNIELFEMIHGKELPLPVDKVVIEVVDPDSQDKV